jgi:hypothetical protein
VVHSRDSIVILEGGYVHEASSYETDCGKFGSATGARLWYMTETASLSLRADMCMRRLRYRTDCGKFGS